MIKKFIPFLYCLTPLCALAESVPGTPGELNEINGNLDVPATESREFMAGSGILVSGTITTADGLYIGITPTTPNGGAISPLPRYYRFWMVIT